eukprot:7285548-Pyramimonas_sp.AAC.1
MLGFGMRHIAAPFHASLSECQYIVRTVTCCASFPHGKKDVVPCRFLPPLALMMPKLPAMPCRAGFRIRKNTVPSRAVPSSRNTEQLP